MLGLVFGICLTIGVTAGLVNVAAAIFSALFSEITSLMAGAASGEGVVLGVMLGLAAFFFFRNRAERRNAGKKASTAKETGEKAAAEPQPEVFRSYSSHSGC